MLFRNGSERAFTLLELMIALAVFGVISASAFMLVAKHQPIFNQQQNQAALNISTRNAVAQMQVDLVNGGAGYYAGINIPNWPVAVVINNQVISSTGDCHSGTTYSSTCFDSFTVIKSDSSTPAMNPSVQPATAGGDTNCTTPTDTTHTTVYLIPPAGDTAAQITALAGQFYSGDVILFVDVTGSHYTAATLTSAGTVVTSGANSYISLPHNATTSTGTNSSLTTDPTGMTLQSNTSLAHTFCSTDWVIRLNAVKYDVDTTTDSTDPTLRRTVLVKGNTPSANGVALANEVIGMKVGATLAGTTTDPNQYIFDTSTYTPANDYTQIRSVMVSLIGRTTPNPFSNFTNSFDQGPYEIEGSSIVVNPRNQNF